MTNFEREDMVPGRISTTKALIILGVWWVFSAGSMALKPEEWES